MRVGQRLEEFFDFPDQRELLLVLTCLLLVLFHDTPQWYVRAGVLTLGLLGLVLRPLLHHAGFWLLAALWFASALLFYGYEVDNHKFLMSYWLCALFLALRREEAAAALQLRRSASVLIGLTLLTSVAWKIASPDYLSGAYFHYALLTDPRFATVTRLAGRLRPEQIEANVEHLRAFRTALAQGADSAVAPLLSTPTTALVAKLLTGWTLFIESTIGLLYLWPFTAESPRGRHASALRSFALLLFAATTYAFVTVQGFAWLLMILGLAATDAGARRWHLAFFAAFLLMVLYEIPLGALVASSLQGSSLDGVPR